MFESILLIYVLWKAFIGWVKTFGERGGHH